MTTRGITVVFALLLVAVPLTAVPVGAETASGPPDTASYATGRPVDDVTLETAEDRLTLLVSDDNPSGTPLVLNRQWLRDKLGKPLKFMRFHRQGELVGSYRLTKQYVIIDIPHFSTQNVTVTTVDGQFEVTGSATGQSTDRVINYDVNETGIAVLEINGRGDREGPKRVGQFYSQTDNGSFQWETGEIPRNVTLQIEGHGSKLGPKYNKSFSGVSDGNTVFFDLKAKDYQPNVTLVGSGEKNGSVVEKGVFRNQSDGDQQTLTFDFDQNNESVVFTGNTTSKTVTTTENYNERWQSATDWDNHVSEEGVVHESFGDRAADTVQQGYPSVDRGGSGLVGYWHFDEDSGSTLSDVAGGTQDDGSTSGGVTLGQTGFTSSTAISLDGTDDVVTVPHSSELNVGGNNGDGTWTGWIHHDLSSSQGVVMLKGKQQTAGSNNFQYRILIKDHDGDGTYGDLQFCTNDGYEGGGWHCANDQSDAFTPGQWHLFTITYDASAETLYFYENGSQISSFNFATSNFPSSGDSTYSFEFGRWESSGVWFKGRIDEPRIYNRMLSDSDVAGLYDTGKDGGLATASRTFSNPVDPSTLNLTNVTATQNGETTEITVKSDPDVDGTFEETSNKISLDGSGSYEVTGLSSESKTFRLDVRLSTSTITQSTSLSRADLSGTYSSSTTTVKKTEDPAIDLNGDGDIDVNYTGKLTDGESVVVNFSDEVDAATYTATIFTANGSGVDWKYQGNNEARTHVKNVSVNGVSYTIDQFLAEGETHTLTLSNLDTLQGENSLTVHTFADSETQHVTRADVRGRYEGRTIVDNYTVNEHQSNLDVALADGEMVTVNVSGDVGYGTNNLTVDLRDNSTQDNYDAELVWHPENRTYFSNVSVNGVEFGSSTFLGRNDTLVFNVTDAVGPGENDHTFRMESAKTTTDTLAFVEKVEFWKNVSVSIAEQHASYTKASTESFNHTATGTSFNFSVPPRVLQHTQTSVVYNGTQTGIANTTTVTSDTVTVQVDEEIPAGTEVSVEVDLLMYRVVNAETELRDENPLTKPYMVEVGATGVTGDVRYEMVDRTLSNSTYEVLLTKNGDLYNETTALTESGNLTIPKSVFTGGVDGFVVQRPQYSTATYTGTVNTIYPTVQLNPDRTVVHSSPLYTEPDESYVRMDNYSAQNLSSPLEVEWEHVGPYHLQWVTNATEDATYTQTLANVTTEGVSVFADGERYRDFTRTADGDLAIHVNGSTTWDVYKYDPPTITSDTNVAVDAGETRTVEVAVHNPNDFPLHNVRLAMDHGWVTKVRPTYQTIPAGGSVTYTVTVRVPSGTQATTYTLPMNVTSTETGEVKTKNLRVSLGQGLMGTGGFPVSRFGLILGGVVLLGALALLGLARSGQLENVPRELRKI